MKWPLKLLLVVAVLAAAELLLGLVSPPRVHNALYTTDARLFWRMRPNVSQQMQVSPEPSGEQLTTVISTNSIGLRDEEIAAAEPGEYRILVLGDSSIFGHGLSLPQTFVKQLQEKLRQAYPAKKIRVINGGVSGYSTFQGRIWFDELTPKVRPNIVILGYYFSDFIPDVMADKDRVPPGFFQLRMMQLLAHSNIYQFLRDEMEQRASVARTSMVARVSVADYRDNLSAMLDACHRRHMQAVMLLLQPRQPSPEQRGYRDTVHTLAAAHGVPLADMEAAFSGQPTYYLDAVHPSAAGDSVIADALSACLKPYLAAPAPAFAIRSSTCL